MHKTQGFLIEGVFSEMPQLGAQDTGTRPTDRITMRGARKPSGSSLRRQVPPKTVCICQTCSTSWIIAKTGDVLKHPEVGLWSTIADFPDPDFWVGMDEKRGCYAP